MKVYNSNKKQLDDASKFGGEGAKSMDDLQGCIDRFITSTQSSTGTPDYIKETLLHWAKTDAVFIPNGVRDSNSLTFSCQAIINSWVAVLELASNFWDVSCASNLVT